MAALRDEVEQLRNKLKGMGDGGSPFRVAFGGEDGPAELLGKLKAERQMLETRREEVQRSIDTTVAELEKI